jgi:hypothetical protein
MAIGATSFRRGTSILSSSSSTWARIPFHRSFSRTPIPSAFTKTTATRAATSFPTTQKATSTVAKPAANPSSSTQSLSARTVTPKPVAKEPAPPTARNTAVDAQSQAAQKQRSLTDGLSDTPAEIENTPAIDWTRSYHGLGSISFTPEQSEILLAPVQPDDVEVKPDGIIYLPEIKYRRILNRAFGPGGWGLAPRGESIVTGKLITREYGLIVQGRYVDIASFYLPLCVCEWWVGTLR